MNILNLKVVKIDRDRLEHIRTRWITLLVFCVCGFAGMAIDFDHFPQILSDALPITWENLSGRTFHIPYFLIFCIILISSATSVHRLFLLVLEDEDEKQVQRTAHSKVKKDYTEKAKQLEKDRDFMNVVNRL